MNNELLLDTLTFVCFLQAESVTPPKGRFLSPTILARLDEQLIVADHIQPPIGAAFGGKHGPTELETSRIRFIHFLCEASGLAALTGRLLLPTPRAAAWLKASPHDRVAQLFDAAFPAQPDRALDQLWRAYRLPGWRWASPTHALAPLLDILRQMRRDELVKPATLLKLTHLDDASLREWLCYLHWFDAIEWHGRAAVKLTDEGTHLLRRSDASRRDAPRNDAPPMPSRLKLTRAGKLIVPPEADWLTLYDVSQYAQLVSPQPRRTYQLDRDLVQRAIQRGEPLTRLVHLLETATGRPVPQAVARSLDEWAREVSHITLRHVTLLETSEPALLSQLASERRTRAGILRTLSPRAVVLRESGLPTLIRRLERQGLAPRVEFSLPAVASTRRKFDRPAIAHLYLAVRLNHQLSEVLPSACRTPYSILLDLEKQLSPRDRDLAAQLADEAAQQILHPPHPPLLLGEGSGMGILPVAEILTLIERAIQSGTPLQIVYYSPYRDEITTRAVEPHRIEWHGRIPYLIAYCQLDQDERTFRVDRIRECRMMSDE
jgi:hypothetical protein